MMTMHTLYVVSVWLHILAAAAWLGGMPFLVLVVIPWMRAEPARRALGARLLSETGPLFSRVGWFCFALLLVTGTFNLYVRGVRVESFGDAAWRASDFGRSLQWKLALFVVVLIVSYVHDFRLGPRASAAVAANPDSPEAEKLRKAASHVGRVTAALALVIVALAVTLVRGCPG